MQRSCGTSLMSTAICLRCGASKRAPYSVCPKCSLDPAGRVEDLVRSVYLSAGRFADDDPRQRTYPAELRTYAKEIAGGREIHFDEAELRRLNAQLQNIRAVPRSAVWMAVIRLFLPAVWFVGGLFALRYLFVMLRH